MNSKIDIDALPGISEDELRRLGPCPICGKMLAETGELTFYRVRTEHCALDANAIQRRAGLEMMMGNSALAAVFSPDRYLARVVDGPHTSLVHESCALNYPIAVLLERKDDDATAERGGR